MSNGLTPIGEAFLAASELQEAAEDLSAAEINKMSMADYAKIRERAGLPSIDPYAEVYSTDFVPPGTPRQEQAPAALGTPEPQPQGIDVASLDMQTYGQLRGQLGVQGREYGRGILDGGSTSDWIAAAQRKSGRSAMNEHGVQQAPPLGRQYARSDVQLDTRSAVQRLSNPGTVWGS